MPSVRSAASDTESAVMDSVLVAFGAAGAPGGSVSNSITCSTASEVPVLETTLCWALPGCSTTAPYALVCFTGSVYRIVALSGPVISAEAIPGLCPSASGTSVVPPPYRGIQGRRTEPVALVGAGSPANSNAHVSPAMRLDESTLRSTPSI